MEEIKINEKIDMLKGYGILLVYLGHSFVFKGIDISNINFINKYIHDTVYSFHMPLFFFISGFLSYKNNEIQVKDYWLKKVKRLFIPYLTVNILDYFSRIIFPNLVNSEFEGINKLLFEGTKISWFVYTLFIMYILFPILRKYFFEKDKYFIFYIILIMLNLLGVFNNIEFFSLNKVTYYLIYFYTGYIFRKFYRKLNKLFYQNITFIISIISLFFLGFRYIISSKVVVIVLAIMGILFSFNLIKRTKENKFIEYIGKNSLEFYLLEGFIAVILRKILLLIIPIESNYILIVSFLLLKVLVGYSLIKILNKSSILSFLLGKEKIKKEVVI